MPNVQSLNDVELLELIKADHEQAFKEIYDRYWKQLYSFAYKRVKSREVAEEIVQEFLTNFWANRNKLKIQTSFEGYIYTSVKHLVLNYFARESRKSIVFENISLTTSHADYSTEQIIRLHELNTVIAKEVSILPEKCRSVFELSRMQNKTNKEIASTLGISEKTVEGHLSKAIKRLKVSVTLMVALLSCMLY
ncbi:RNA polymerase sigma-70 factor [Mucilaginibacter aquatilis]|uniref:RNA polymerase sigma-70 factor n=1 Tax=Mucilaginibacter aquatilis TaxID=1517760 RepID=A0A6I4ICB2_9SPHI|nr:RNA polymerase sigma-70 factor [Mucilaginibacter aquatilis]MVN92871.1 RNA polymerase sigma-70 factor [Mucilaginibacter aquatilis]